MKWMGLGWLLLVGSVAWAGDNEVAQIMGFQKKTDLDLSSVTYQYQDQAVYKFSKERFLNRSGAKSFCSARGMQLASEVDLLTLVMAGAGQMQIINDALNFKVMSGQQRMSGIVGWGDDPSVELVVMMDGGGTDSMNISTQNFRDVLKQDGQKFAGLPAICERTLEMSTSIVNTDRASGQKDVAISSPSSSSGGGSSGAYNQ